MNTGPDVKAPLDWLAANNNKFPNSPGCPISSNTNANDSQMLTLTVRVPTNAKSFTARMFFLSAEYPEYVCTQFNDFTVVLLDTLHPKVPTDKNLAVYVKGDDRWPVGVNLVSSAPGIFSACHNGQISQCGSKKNYTWCTDSSLLSGTGFDNAASACGYFGATGGGTGWLTVKGNVVPGETATLRFAVWDTADSVWDSLVIFDDFQWSNEGTVTGITPGK